MTTDSQAAMYAQTGTTGTSHNFIVGFGHQCCIKPGRRYANQHGFTQYGRCCCGKRYVRRVRWEHREFSGWDLVR